MAVTTPSTSSWKPVASKGTRTVRGCTWRVSGLSQVLTRRTRPRASARTAWAGPMRIRPRRRVTTEKTSFQVSWPARGGTRIWPAPAPMGSSITPAPARRARRLVTAISPIAVCPATTRRLDRCSATAWGLGTATWTSAARRTTAQHQAIAPASTHPAVAATRAATAPVTRAARPAGVRIRSGPAARPSAPPIRRAEAAARGPIPARAPSARAPRARGPSGGGGPAVLMRPRRGPARRSGRGRRRPRLWRRRRRRRGRRRPGAPTPGRPGP